LSKQYKKLGVQAGLRFENTNYEGHQLGNTQKPDSSFNNSYNCLFPTVFLSYTVNEKISLDLMLEEGSIARLTRT
jgi:hypothetical protein